jgi:hemerythrin superfamily protein
MFRGVLKQSQFLSTAYIMLTITEAIRKDHRELADCYHNIMNAPDNDSATRWQNQFTWALSRHLVAEELVVHPVFEKILGEKGTIIADKDRSDHHNVSI